LPHDPTVTGRVLFYVQHLLGIGHLRRALRLVEAMAQEGLAVTLVSGGEALPELAAAPAERVVQLAPIRARDTGFRDLVDGEGRPVGDELRNARRAALLAAFAQAEPEAVLIEAFPFGRRAFRFELDPLIGQARARQSRPLLLCSLRDIVVPPAEDARRRAIVDRVRADFDAVLVHGDPAAIPLEASFPEAASLADKLVYTGYVGPPPAADAGDASGRGEVLVSAGGGAVGYDLLRAAIEARRTGCLVAARWRLLAGPNLPSEQYGELAGNLPEGVVIERYRADFPAMLRHCRVSLSQAGYNTVLDILAAGARAVLVPFAADRETEQSLRAAWLAARGLVECVAEADLSPSALAAAIVRAVTRPPLRATIDMQGAARSARLIAEMIRRRSQTGRSFVKPPSNDMIAE
jgi:predicted glycosyltransferase